MVTFECGCGGELHEVYPGEDWNDEGHGFFTRSDMKCDTCHKYFQVELKVVSPPICMDCGNIQKDCECKPEDSE